MLENDFLVSRMTGTFFGIAIGDALGRPVTGLSTFEVLCRFQTVDAYYSYNREKPGSYGLVTRDAFNVSKSIYEKAIIDLEDIRNNISNKETPFCADFLPRIVPLALFLSFKPLGDIEILKACRDVVLLTQSSKEAVLPAFVVAKTIIEVVRNRKTLDNHGELFQNDNSLFARLVNTLRSIEQKLEKKPSVLFSERMHFVRRKLQSKASTEEFLGINGNSTADECASFSLFSFMKSPDSFKSVITAASMGGNASVNASLVGSMIGAYSGPIAFPQDFRDSVENSGKIILLGENFVEKFQVEEK